MSESEVQGVALNDAHGLCVQATGDLAYTAADQTSGFFTSIAEKAIDLGASAEDGDDADGDAARDPEQEAQTLPIVRIETSARTLLVAKVETDGRERTLVLSKPRGGAGLSV